MTRSERLESIIRDALELLPHEPQGASADWRDAALAALERGRGKPRTIDRDEVRRLAGTMPVVAIAEKLGVSRQAIHLIIKND
jgi:hypothetical protein